MRINATSVLVDDQQKALQFRGARLPEEDRDPRRSGLQPPVDHGTVVTAVLDDTCGNLIQIAAEKADR